MESHPDDSAIHHSNPQLAPVQPLGPASPMKIVVTGLWHLGCVTAACCARHHQVTGLDFDPATVAGLQHGKAPLFEPGLDELIGAGLSRGTLAFTTDAQT